MKECCILEWSIYTAEVAVAQTGNKKPHNLSIRVDALTWHIYPEGTGYLYGVCETIGEWGDKLRCVFLLSHAVLDFFLKSAKFYSYLILTSM